MELSAFKKNSLPMVKMLDSQAQADSEKTWPKVQTGKKI